MKGHADQHGDAACDGEQELLSAIVVSVALWCVSFPGRGAHAGRRHGLQDGIGGGLRGFIQHRHAAVQDVEGEPFLPTDDWANSLLQDGHLLGAIHSAHLEDLAVPRRVCRLGSGFGSAAGVCLMSMSVTGLVIMRVEMSHWVSMLARRRFRNAGCGGGTLRVARGGQGDAPACNTLLHHLSGTLYYYNRHFPAQSPRLAVPVAPEGRHASTLNRP